MRILKLLCVYGLTGFTAACQPANSNLTIEVETASPLQKDERIFIAGNQEQLGAWNPSEVPLRKDGDLWTRVYSFPVGTAVEFKFTKGSWNTEALGTDARVPPNHQLTLAGDTTLHFVIPYWKDSLLNSAPEISGNYRIHDAFPVQGLDARRVIVWLPPSYAAESQRRYPVLYVQDGQNVFDPYTSTLGHDWRIDEIADSLIQRGEIEEFICVAIYCDTDVRGAEYSDDPDLGDKYQEFMCCQLKPWVDSVYRTDPAPDRTAVMGASMGGLISFILAWEYPDIFGMAACMSPAFKYEQNGVPEVNYVDNVLEDSQKRNIDLYIDNGTIDLEALLQPGIDEMLSILDERGYQYRWFQDEGAPHNEIAWSARVWKPLLQFFGKR